MPGRDEWIIKNAQSTVKERNPKTGEMEENLESQSSVRERARKNLNVVDKMADNIREAFGADRISEDQEMQRINRANENRLRKTGGYPGT